MMSISTARQAIVTTVAILTVLFVAWFVVQIRSTLVLLLIGILFASAIEPLVNRLRRRGIGWGQAILTVYLVLLGPLGLLVVAVAPPLVTQGSQLIGDVPNMLQELRDRAAASDSEFVRDNGVRVIDETLAAWERLQTNPPIEQDQALSFVTSIFGFLFTTVTVLIVAFYWLTEKAMSNGWCSASFRSTCAIELMGVVRTAESGGRAWVSRDVRRGRRRDAPGLVPVAWSAHWRRARGR